MPNTAFRPALPGPAGTIPPPPRGAAWLPEDDPQGVDGFSIQPARTSYERLAAASLVRRMYTWRGYRTEAPLPTPDGDARRLTLIAWQGGEAVATLTLGVDSPAGLLCEALYPLEVAQLRQEGQTICEVSRLAVDPDHSSRYLLTTLFRVAHEYGRETFGATDVVIEVNPRHVGYYQREFGFTRIGDLRHCPRVAAPAVLLHRPLHAFTLPLGRNQRQVRVMSLFSSAVGA